MSQLSASQPVLSYTSGEPSAPAAPSSAARWTGRIMSGLVVAFLVMDAVMKFVKPELVVKTTVELGFNESVILPLGVTLLVSTLLYAFPRTAVLGAILLTGYLGGAVCTHVRVANPLFSHTLFPTYVGVLIWGGLLLREPRLRALLPLRTSTPHE